MPTCLGVSYASRLGKHLLYIYIYIFSSSCSLKVQWGAYSSTEYQSLLNRSIWSIFGSMEHKKVFSWYIHIVGKFWDLCLTSSFSITIHLLSSDLFIKTANELRTRKTKTEIPLDSYLIFGAYDSSVLGMFSCSPREVKEIKVSKKKFLFGTKKPLFLGMC